MQNEDMPDSKPATKADLRGLKADIRRVAIHVTNLESKLSTELRAIESNNSKRASEFFSKVDAFMSRTIKVETDETFLIHRMDNLEKRVSSLETRAP